MNKKIFLIVMLLLISMGCTKVKTKDLNFLTGTKPTPPFCMIVSRMHNTFHCVVDNDTQFLVSSDI